MRSTKRITARVPPETSARFQALAVTYGLNESRFMSSLIDRAVEVVGETGNKIIQRNQDESRAERF